MMSSYRPRSLSLRAGEGPNDVGASRHHLIRATDKALKRLGTDYVDLLQLHHFDVMTPVESVMSTLDDLVRAGKVSYIGASNFSGWHLMKSLAVSDRYGYARYVAHQVYYSLIGRDYEWELMPLGLDQGVGAVVWSPLGWSLSTEQVAKLDAASAVTPPYPYYPYWNGQFSERNPAPVPVQPGTRDYG